MFQQIPGLRFRRKLEAMTNRADHWRSLLDKEDWPGLSKLLEEFSAFAKDYTSLLEKTPESISRPPFVLNMGVARLLQEWSVLSRACEQRLGLAEDANDTAGFQWNLREAGELAKNYCDHWHPQRPIEAPYQELREPVVYFEKLYRISRAAYAPETPVVSIPLTDYNDSTCWQALAHELGHHIYWNGVDLRTSEMVHKRLHDAMAEALSAPLLESSSKALDQARLWGRYADRMRLWGHWLEEVFADVCGTLLAGPYYAASAQDLMADRINKTEDLTKGDYQHPSAYLRPLISLQVLREIAKHSNASFPHKTGPTREKEGIKRLENRWEYFCQKAGELPYAETGLTMEDLATDDIEAVVRVILYEPVWPHGRRLWDLIEFYGEEDVKALEQMELTLLPEILDGKPSGIKNDPPDIADSLSFKRLWEDLRNRVNSAELGEEQKPLLFWALLLGMDLSEAMPHIPHECTDEHWHFPYCGWWRKHKHPQDGSTVICC